MNNDNKLLLLALLALFLFAFIGFCIGRATSTPTDFAVWYDAPGSDKTMGAEGRIVRFVVGGKVYVVNADTQRDPRSPLVQSGPFSVRD
jgi:hypothetical protein